MISNNSRRVIENSGLTDISISNHPGINAVFTAFITITARIFMGIVIGFLIAVLYNMFRKKTDKKTGL
jgi:NhaP-type Na+/H+ or K+/H+ antiporter